MLEVLQAKNLKSLYGMRHGFFTRKGGVSKEPAYAGLNCGLSSQDDKNCVTENRRLVALYLETNPDLLLSCHQVHSPDVVTVTEKWVPDQRPKADAMVTRQRGIALGVLTADCVPVLFADVRSGVIGAAHAGWRGALSGVLENTIKAMEDLGANRSSIEAAIGACIWQNSYEVGPEFPAPFLAENPDNQKFFRPSIKSGSFMFNLPAYVEAKLKAAKVAYVESSPADTAADADRFFSYRRNCLAGDPKVGSLISVITMIGRREEKEDDDFRGPLRSSLDAEYPSV